MSRKRNTPFLSQNFLVDEKAADRLIDTFDVSTEDVVLEIGPGRGSLTSRLIGKPLKLFVIEKDRRLVHNLKTRYGSETGLEILSGDFLESDLSALVARTDRSRLRILGAIPYHITTPILLHILDHRESVTDALLVVQKEVAKRIAAEPGTRAYGSLTVAVRYRADPVLLFPIGSDSFKPRPRVDSQVIHLTMRDAPPVQPRNPDLFFYLVRRLFTQRRKQIQKFLRTDKLLSFEADDVKRLESRTGISLKKRPEELSIHDFAKLADAVLENPGSSNFIHKAGDQTDERPVIDEGS